MSHTTTCRAEYPTKMKNAYNDKMIVAFVWLTVGQQLTFGKLHSRQEFVDAMKEIHSASFGKERQTKELIYAQLGQPDDVILPSEPDAYGETWCYGTNGHRTIPTLGSVTFKDDKLIDFRYSPKPPHPTIIAEAELRTALRKMYRPVHNFRLDDGVDFNKNDPLELIRVSNLLIPMGVEKAVAVLSEFGRLDPQLWPRYEFPYWISRIMFKGKIAGYIFPNPRLGQLNPAPTNDLSKWPTYPVLTLSGLPIPITWDASRNGEPPSFYRYSLPIKRDWQIIDHPLIPPNDPFPLYHRALAMKVLAEENEMGRSLIAGAIIRSVRNAIHVKNSDWQTSNDVNEAGFEALHQKFLSLKCRWSAKLGHYVRGDGTFDPDRIRPRILEVAKN